MIDIKKVLVKETDALSAKSLLELLNSSISGMKRQVAEKPELTPDNKLAIAGAIEALTDLHNLILGQLQEIRNSEVFDDSTREGGGFDA